MGKNYSTDGMDDITLQDLKRGYHIYDGKRYPISYEIKRVKDLKYGQLFKLPNPKGEITNTFSDSPVARRYSRVWMKVPKGYRGWRETASRGSAMIVPYDDPSGESGYVKLTQQVLAFNVVDYNM